MYLMAKGECRAYINDPIDAHNNEYDSDDEERKESKKSNLKCWEVKHEVTEENTSIIRPGVYFGEIALVWRCQRSADVIS